MPEYIGVEGHWFTYGRHQKGKTPIRPTRPVYATTAHCSCGGWRGKSNWAPSRGGVRDLANDHREHVKEARA